MMSINKLDFTQNLFALPCSPQFLVMYKKILGRKLTTKEIKLLRSLKADLRKQIAGGKNA